MKVINKSVSGCLNGIQWPEPGEEFEVPDHVGADLAAAGLVEPVAKKAASSAEKRPAVKRVETRKAKG